VTKIFYVERHMWHPKLTARCVRCGHRYSPTTSAISTARGIQRNLETYGPLLHFFQDPRLQTKCSLCKANHRLNPFVIENPLMLLDGDGGEKGKPAISALTRGRRAAAAQAATPKKKERAKMLDAVKKLGTAGTLGSTLGGIGALAKKRNKMAELAAQQRAAALAREEATGEDGSDALPSPFLRAFMEDNAGQPVKIKPQRAQSPAHRYRKGGKFSGYDDFGSKKKQPRVIVMGRTPPTPVKTRRAEAPRHTLPVLNKPGYAVQRVKGGATKLPPASPVRIGSGSKPPPAAAEAEAPPAAPTNASGEELGAPSAGNALSLLPTIKTQTKTLRVKMLFGR